MTLEPQGERSLSAAHSIQLTRISGFIVRARNRFAATRHDKGNVAAFTAMLGDIRRSALFRLAYGIQRALRLRRVVAALPFKHRFMQPGVLFIGYVEAGLGLGQSLRSLIRSISASGLPFALYPFNRGVETRFIGRFAEERYDLVRRYQVNVIEMSADQVPGMFREIGLWKTAQSYNILRTYWELPSAPAEWATMLDGIHEIWAPNQFIANAFQDIFRGPIGIIPPCVEIDTEPTLERRHFGMKPSEFYFVFSFDYLSHPARKNPLSVVRAFQRAFPRRGENVGLLIKSTGHADRFPDTEAAILRAAKEDARITVIDRMFARGEMLSLIRLSDCYVSLHRSEGFGLGMAEAMAFGKPVIGTDYSGSTDFLSARTGFPVPYELCAVQPGEYPFAAGQSWADPDEAAAAEAMRRVFFDREECQRRAAAGKALVQARYGSANVGRLAAERLQEIMARQVV